MNARFALALLVLMFAPCARGGDAPRFAVAGGDGADACVALPPAWERDAQRVDVRIPDDRAYHAHVGHPLQGACKALADALVEGPFHAIAFDGVAPAGRWFAILERAGGAPAQVLGCTSQEGLHLSAWIGTPRRSERLWHHYIYLGYDVEPTCTGGDDTAP